MQQDTSGPADQPLRAIEHACRGVVGDRLRRLSVDAPEHSGTLYRRSDLAPGADSPVHEAMAAGASCQSPVLADGGWPSSPSGRADRGRSPPPAADPESDRTVCAFARGYVTRVQVGETSVVATTDGLKMDRDTELSAAVRGVLE